MSPSAIRVISICSFRHQDRVLVNPSYDRVKDSWFYRPLGGGVDPGETAARALVREIREEIDAEIEDPQLVTVLENLFTYEGAPGHEIVFVYDARFADESIYDLEEVTGVEDDGKPFTAVWRRLDSFDDQHRLVPEALFDIL